MGDRARIISDTEGFKSLNPTGYTLMYNESSAYDTAAKIDNGFTSLMNETARTLVVIYYSGHGIMEPGNSTFKTCAVLNETVTVSDQEASAA